MKRIATTAFILALLLAPVPALSKADDWQTYMTAASQASRAFKYTEAEQQLNMALGTVKKSDPRRATTLLSLGSVLAKQSKFGPAESALQEALDLTISSGGRNSVSHAKALHLQGMLYGTYQKRYAEAITAYQEAIRVYGEANQYKDDPNLAETFDNLATIYMNQGSYAEAAAYQQQAMDIYEKRYGAAHPEVGLMLTHMSMLAEKQGQHEAAIASAKRAYGIFEKSPPKNESEFATALYDLGTVYQLQQKDLEARLLFEKALALQTRVNGDTHKDTLATMEALGTIYKSSTDKQAEGEQMLEKARQIQQGTNTSN